MVNYNGASLQAQIKKLLEQNLAYSKEIHESIKKIRHYILLGRIMSFIYLIIIIAPIILGIIYLPSFIQGALNNFIPGALNQSANQEGLLGDQELMNGQGNFFDIYKNLIDSQD